MMTLTASDAGGLALAALPLEWRCVVLHQFDMACWSWNRWTVK